MNSLFSNFRGDVWHGGYLLTYAHRSRWSIGHLRPLAIALCSGLLWPFSPDGPLLFQLCFNVSPPTVARPASLLRMADGAPPFSARCLPPMLERDFQSLLNFLTFVCGFFKLIYYILFYSRLCPSTAGSSPPPESSIFLCPLLSLSIPLLVAPQCHLSNDVLVFRLILHPLSATVCF